MLSAVRVCMSNKRPVFKISFEAFYINKQRFFVFRLVAEKAVQFYFQLKNS